MSAINNYYAEVGMEFDKESLARVKRELDKVEGLLKRFGTRVGRDKSNSLNIRVNRTALNKEIRNSAVRAIRQAQLSLPRLNIRSQVQAPRVAAPRRVPTAVGASQASGTTTASSFSAIIASVEKGNKTLALIDKSVNRVGDQLGKMQSRGIVTQPARGFSWFGRNRGASGGTRGTDYGRRSFRGTTQSATTNRSTGVGSTGLSRRSSSPFHNPFMVGGFTGSLLRYGAHALPFYGGVLGINALSNKAADLERNRVGLDMAADLSGTGKSGEYYRSFLDKLGEDLGVSGESMVKSFTQMLSSTGGTSLEGYIEEGYASIRQFSAVMGLTEEQVDSTVRALTKMMTNPKLTAAELKSTPQENLPPIMRLMAEAVAGGDMDTLTKMLQEGKLTPEIAMPQLFAEMNRRSNPYMEDYYDRVTYKQSESKRLGENFVKELMGAGGTDAVKRVFDALNLTIKALTGDAGTFGGILQRAGYLISGLLLIPKELSEWLNMKPKEGNLFSTFFGDRYKGDFVDQLNELTTIMREEVLVPLATGAIKSLIEVLPPLVSVISDFTTMLVSVIRSIRDGQTLSILDNIKRDLLERDVRIEEYNINRAESILKGKVKDLSNPTIEESNSLSQEEKVLYQEWFKSSQKKSRLEGQLGGVRTPEEAQGNYDNSSTKVVVDSVYGGTKLLSETIAGVFSFFNPWGELNPFNNRDKDIVPIPATKPLITIKESGVDRDRPLDTSNNKEVEKDRLVPTTRIDRESALNNPFSNYDFTDIIKPIVNSTYNVSMSSPITVNVESSQDIDPSAIARMVRYEVDSSLSNTVKQLQTSSANAWT